MKKIIYLGVFLLITSIYSVSYGAIGDTIAPTCTSVASAGVLDIQPSSGVEWLIHNVWFEDNITIQRYDGTNTINVAAFVGPNYQPLMTRVNNTSRIRIRNDHGSLAKLVCFDGVITKE